MNKQAFREHSRIFWALLRRDLYVQRSKIPDLLIDSMIVLLTEILILGKLYPLLGLPSSYVAPLFIGSSVTFLLFDLGYSFAMRYTYYRGYEEMSYQLTLPLPKQWVFAEHIVAFVIEAAIVTVPLIAFGIFTLKDIFEPLNGSVWLFTLVYSLTLFYFGSYFFAASFWYDKEWFQDNMWPRRLSPLLFFSSAFYAWHDVYALSPILGKLLLLNPLTYVVEAMRAALLGQEDYLPLMLCITVTLVCIILDWWRITQGIHRQLDPV